jgi:hypothetical protein
LKIFIIGNGTSLKASDLDLIAGLPSIACNRINLIYPQTKWRPSIYTHPESLAPNLPYIQEHVDMGISCYLGEHFAEPPRGKLTLKDAPNIHWINDHPCHLLSFFDPELPDEWLLPQLCSFGGSVNLMMQIAVLNGYDELILLGCDLEYRDNKPSHFDPRYEYGGEYPAFTRARNAFFGHVQALNWIRRFSPKIKVYNATRGGLLELWERVWLEDVI